MAINSSHVKGGGSGETASVYPFTRALPKDLPSQEPLVVGIAPTIVHKYETRATRGLAMPIAVGGWNSTVHKYETRATRGLVKPRAVGGWNSTDHSPQARNSSDSRFGHATRRWWLEFHRPQSPSTKLEIWPSYTPLEQGLTEDDPDRTVEFCESALKMHKNVPDQNWLKRLSLCVDRKAEHIL
ncbi:hypothetical protein AVEN_220973-1 [Araneus ventricosus]|uniref:Uncharacterized protein n=1 Tax=Araneus ventricosus TaxID=182803 RepID=A0A4Y2NHI3_ARAVE|nr:hypothetical protein AVEN_220973-1 [Araneus ventricosus]